MCHEDSGRAPATWGTSDVRTQITSIVQVAEEESSRASGWTQDRTIRLGIEARGVNNNN